MQKDIKVTLREMGIEVKVMGYELLSPKSNEEYFYVNLIKKLDETVFDAVMSVHFFPVIAKACCQKGVKYLSWIYDSPFIPIDMESFCLDNVYSFVFDQYDWGKLKQKGAKHVFHFPLAVNVKRLDKIEFTEEETEEYSADASFVGQSYRDGRDDPARIRVCGKRALEETIYERMEMMKRVSQICEFKWYSAEKADELPFVKCMGTVGYYTNMPKVFKLSKININVTLKSIRSGIPLRIYDILGAGGFLITNDQPELHNYFSAGKDLEIYQSLDELTEKVSYYLKHKKQRQEIAQRGREKCRELFSFERQLTQILQLAEIM
jgi:spore maturation protein CgeB